VKDAGDLLEDSIMDEEVRRRRFENYLKSNFNLLNNIFQFMRG